VKVRQETAGFADQIPYKEIRKRWRTILDQAETALRTHNTKITSFLNPGEWEYADSLLSHYSDLRWILEGGYHEAERRRLIMMPDYRTPEDLLSPVAFLRVIQKTSIKTLTHRDYLGAVLSLGVEREMIGDILVYHHSACIVVVPELRDYLMWHLDSVGSVSVTVSGIDEIPELEIREELEVTKGTVASLRLDAVLSIALRISRQKAQALIESQKVSLNWKPVQKHTVVLHEHDIISIQGSGRLKLLKIGILSRSQRWQIEIGKMK
jgi:RNA-binding protein YlmH